MDTSKLPEEEDFHKPQLLLEPSISLPELREKSDLLVVLVRLSLNESYINLVFYIYYFFKYEFYYYLKTKSATNFLERQCTYIRKTLTKFIIKKRLDIGTV